MVQLFRDRMRREGRGWRKLTIWTHLMFDLAASALREHAGGFRMSTDKPVIEAEFLTKVYGRTVAVDGLSVSVPRGRTFGLLGPNGSGKTTTMGMLLGLVRPTSGTFSLFGSTDRLEESLRRVGAIIEYPSFYPYLTGRENLLYFQGIFGRGAPEEIDGLLERVGLADSGDRRFSTYSLGMKQRLGLAFALLGSPEVLFLDEPTNGMDPAGMAEVRHLIRELRADGRTVLMASHLLNEVEQVCDSVAIMSRGTLIAQGEVSDILQTGEQLRLRTTDDAKAVSVLAELDWIEGVKMEDGEVVVSAPGDKTALISTALGRSGVYVIETNSGRGALERYFLEVTGVHEEVPEDA
ncbi:MAG: ATP-binding cassette domain-containing protein [Chloroflexi bacterium]|nr:ATP-binding cassette domain-containing protein [Chloroflexota bacterium]